MMCIQCWARGWRLTRVAALVLGFVMSVLGSRPPPESSEPVQVPRGRPRWAPACLACCVPTRGAPGLQPLRGLDKLLKGRARSEPSWASPGNIR